jgi:hypothetical protein
VLLQPSLDVGGAQSRAAARAVADTIGAVNQRLW